MQWVWFDSQHKNKHKGTWMHPKSKSWHIIDFIIVRSRDHQDLFDVKVMRSIEWWADHRHLKASFNTKIKVTSKHLVTRPPKRINVNKLNRADTQQQLADKIKNFESLDEINIWSDFKSKLYTFPLISKGTYIGRKRQKRFNDNDAGHKTSTPPKTTSG